MNYKKKKREKKKETSLYLTGQQLKERERENASKVIDVYNAMALWVLRNEFGFGRTRLDRFMDGINKEADMLAENRYNFYDLKKTLKEETGIDV